jgi:hypothetical protein
VQQRVGGAAGKQRQAGGRFAAQGGWNGETSSFLCRFQAGARIVGVCIDVKAHRHQLFVSDIGLLIFTGYPVFRAIGAAISGPLGAQRLGLRQHQGHRSILLHWRVFVLPRRVIYFCRRSIGIILASMVEAE